MCRKDYFMNTKIDKIKLTNVPIAKIDDPDRLRKDGILIKDKKGQNYMAGSGQEFTRLTVKDKVVDQYVVGYDSLHAPYTKMELSVKKKNGNLECNSVADTYSQMLHTQEHLLEEYGIVTDCTDAKISYLEINRTFPLNGRFADYKRVFILLMSRLPKNKGVQIDFKNIIDNSYVLDEYVATNNSSAIKIYNKNEPQFCNRVSNLQVLPKSVHKDLTNKYGKTEEEYEKEACKRAEKAGVETKPLPKHIVIHALEMPTLYLARYSKDHPEDKELTAYPLDKFLKLDETN